MNWLKTLYRWFGACLLCFFAFFPLYVGVGSISVVVKEPAKFDLFFVFVISACVALSYFLLLLAFRAATNRGRKSDAGLLPPLAMKFIIGLFGVTAICIVAMGVYQGEAKPVFGGIGYLIASAAGWRAVTARASAAQQGIQADAASPRRLT